MITNTFKFHKELPFDINELEPETTEQLIKLIFELSNQSQEAAGVRPVTFSSYNRTTKQSLFVETYPPVKEVRCGTKAWDLLLLSDTVNLENENMFLARMHNMTISYDPALASNRIVVGKINEKPILLTLVF